MTNVPIWKLNNGIEIPSLGFGVFKVKEGDEVFRSVLEALEAGYRLIDTAAIYGNEEGVGRAIKASGLKREEIFLTTKLWNTDQGYDSVFEAFETSLKKLDTDYVDLYLIHWPGKDKFVESYKALEKLYSDKKVRAIGVCNFHIHHLEELMAETEIVPAMNQIELHPLMNQRDILDFCKDKGIQVEAWGPLMQGKGDLEAELFVSLGNKYGKSPAQIILRWHHQNGVLAIPKSVTPSRIKENIDIFDFELTEEDMKKIDAHNENRRLSADPDTFMNGFE
ncbi:aldo/keto reductase [Proteiniclasticum sp.]|uniref:aldo/keto reductase n=1 Tax=Proteiniclasticum sp. TaxID=2053595 RepID=UPI00289646E0|nr:aldo/keto reductase [Proteiniclasticum sp.]